MAGSRETGEGGAPLALVVIGHVNHGKTALVGALTGTATDRLKEEIARGMSIALGFAWRDGPGGGIDVIDAPGHEDFIRAMAMGASGARAALLVVSAVEGVRRQTVEHLRVAQALGVGAGVVAVTKSDLLAPEEAAAAAGRIAAELAGTFLAEAPAHVCSARIGAGLDGLAGALGALASQAPPPPDLPGAFLPLDRVFTVPGVGAVATGTLQGGPLAVGDTVELAPSGRTVILRQLQVHGRNVERVEPGGRVAVGLRGVSADEVAIGEVVCTPGAFAPSLLVDVELTLSADSARPLRANDELRALWGARQDMARVRLLDGGPIPPGGRGLAQLRFRTPTVAYAGQRGVLRRPSPAETIGGLLVLDPIAAPIRGRVEQRRAVLQSAAIGDPEAIAQALAAQGGEAVRLSDAARLARRPPAEVQARLSPAFDRLDGDVLASREMVAELERRYVDALADAHGAAPLRLWTSAAAIRSRLQPGVARDLIAFAERRLADAGLIRLSGPSAALASHDPRAALSPAAQARLEAIEQAFRAGGMTPPARADLPEPDDPALLDLLLEEGRLIALHNVALRQTLLFHAAALIDAADALRAAFPPPAAFATGEARIALATSRKFIVPVLERLDDDGVTLRNGDVRRVAKAEG